MANAVADEGGTSMSQSAGGGESKVCKVRCVVHNFPDCNDDNAAVSTIQSLLEGDLIVQHRPLSVTGLYDFT